MDLVLLGAVPTVALAFAAAIVLDAATEQSLPANPPKSAGRMIEIDSITKRYGETTVVDDVSMTIEPRTVTVIVGTSGSGKTTLMRMINRLVEPSSGTILLDGADNRSVPGHELAPQHRLRHPGHGLFPHRTVAENIATVADAARLGRRAHQGEGRGVAGLLQLDPAAFGPRYPHELSGGQQQRVGVARALAAEPNILLMDEPLARSTRSSGPRRRKTCWRSRSISARPSCSSPTTWRKRFHLGDRIAVMDKGKIVAVCDTGRDAGQPGQRFRRDADRRLRASVQASVARHRR
jgi:osmoprotectant transport system ATP-binding protein